jgi:hypothetical protein
MRSWSSSLASASHSRAQMLAFLSRASVGVAPCTLSLLIRGRDTTIFPERRVRFVMAHDRLGRSVLEVRVDPGIRM